MTWDEYKHLCDQPNYWSRWMLEQSAQLLRSTGEAQLAQVLESAMHQPALAKPSDHKGPAATDMFELNLSLAQRETGLASIISAQAAGLTTSATQARGLGGFVEAWQEYVALSTA